MIFDYVSMDTDEGNPGGLKQLLENEEINLTEDDILFLQDICI